MAPTAATTLRKALHHLEAERQRIDRQISTIHSLLGAAGHRRRKATPKSRPEPKPGRRRMSAAARRAVSQRMKAYWAKRKAAKAKAART